MAAERPEDVDEEFNRIVSGLGPGWTGALPAWPDPPDAVDPAPAALDDQVNTAGPERAPEEPPVSERPDEHFQPPPPPPLPRLEPVTAGCWVLVLGVPVLLMLTALSGWSAPRWVLGAVALGFVTGVVTLILRLDDHPRDTDNGAVV